MSLESGGTTGQSKEADSGDVGVNRKETESKILELKKQKRAKKTATTKVRHNVEKLCALKGTANVEEIEEDIEVLWGLLDVTMGILDELSFLYITLDDEDGKKAIAAEADSFEVEINECINKAQIVIKESMKAKVGQSVGESVSEQASLPPVQQASESNSPACKETRDSFKVV